MPRFRTDKQSELLSRLSMSSAFSDLEHHKTLQWLQSASATVGSCKIAIDKAFWMINMHKEIMKRESCGKEESKIILDTIDYPKPNAKKQGSHSNDEFAPWDPVPETQVRTGRSDHQKKMELNKAKTQKKLREGFTEIDSDRDSGLPLRESEDTILPQREALAALFGE